MHLLGYKLIIDFSIVPKIVAIALTTQIVRFVCLVYRTLSLSATQVYHAKVFADDMQPEIDALKAYADARVADCPLDATCALPREIDVVVSGGGFKVSEIE